VEICPAKLLCSKGNNQHSEKGTYRMGEKKKMKTKRTMQRIIETKSWYIEKINRAETAALAAFPKQNVEMGFQTTGRLRS
jgi:hypothetical protein